MNAIRLIWMHFSLTIFSFFFSGRTVFVPFFIISTDYLYILYIYLLYVYAITHTEYNEKFYNFFALGDRLLFFSRLYGSKLINKTLHVLVIWKICISDQYRQGWHPFVCVIITPPPLVRTHIFSYICSRYDGAIYLTCWQTHIYSFFSVRSL